MCSAPNKNPGTGSLTSCPGATPHTVSNSVLEELRCPSPSRLRHVPLPLPTWLRILPVYISAEGAPAPAIL